MALGGFKWSYVVLGGFSDDLSVKKTKYSTVRIFLRIYTEIKVLSNFVGTSDVCLEISRDSKN